MNDSELTTSAREVAKSLTYNESRAEAAAKHLLLEMAHRIDVRDIKVRKNQDGFVIRNGLGEERYMTLFEILRWKMFGFCPERV